MAMMFCRGCGKEIHETAPTCPHCGAPQGALTAPTPVAGGDGFLELGLQPFKKFAQFSGRARRKEYWYFVLICTLINIVAMNVSGVLYLVTSLVFFIPSLAAGVRRLHDTDRSGWWLIVPIANLVFLCFDSQPGQNRFGPGTKYA